jgi:glutamine synthetase
MNNYFAEYIWIDGKGKLRSKTKVLKHGTQPGEWGFDGSSTEQATTESSDCILRPACITSDPLRGIMNKLVLCDVLKADRSPDEQNNRVETARLFDKYEYEGPWFGMEQEYTMYKGVAPLALSSSLPPVQGPYYCGVGADEVCGRDIVEEHMKACLAAGLKLSGVNAEVMPGQWEFQIGPGSPLIVSDHIWLARYLLYRIAETHGVTIKLNPKPLDELNGAGMHTNFSTVRTRRNYSSCVEAAQLLGVAIIEEPLSSDELLEGQIYPTFGYPAAYGKGFERRLTGDHETCSHRDFRWGVSDRGGSVRIPLHVKEAECGYIEDRRPGANADPYAVCNYIMEAVCGVFCG